jgi:hypothetical protein
VGGPGITLICPVQLHISLHASVKAGFFPTNTVGEPGVHGAVMTGTQGMGVKTPIAADVALATVGLDKELHMPKGMMFFIGTLSMIVPTGFLPAITRFSGVTTKILGAAPKLHWSCAPAVTNIAMFHLKLKLNRSSSEVIPDSGSGHIIPQGPMQLSSSNC